MFAIRMYGVAAATLGVLAMGACDDPELNTDLRPAGPPEVLAVLVMTDAASQLVEVATYCKPDDELRPTLVGLPDFTTQTVCPEDGDPDPVVTAYPDGWYIRIMFDELLDPSIEELTPVLDEDGVATGAFTGSIVNSRPVTLQCRSSVSNQFVNVDYDGYYSPSGNRVTWPVGPSIVIKPNDPTLIGTGTECQVTLTDTVTDKEFIPVPEAQRGPFSFQVAPITVVALDPPVDDPDFEAPIDAVTIYYDNAYVLFNTSVDYTSICPDEDDDGLCDDEKTFSFRDVAHPTQGPGYCNVTLEPCGQLTDCPSGGGDTVCGRGFCGDSGDPCNVVADCTGVDDLHCGTNYAYDYVAFGSTDAEWGLGPVNPLETDRQYTFQFTQGAVLRDRCGKATTFGAPNVDDQTLAHFVTSEFDFNSATIVTGEVASAMKRLQFNFNNVLEGSDTASANSTTAYVPSPAIDASSGTPAFTVTPLPKVLTAACPGGGAACATADIALGDLLVVSPNADGQTQMSGHLQMNTEYTATLKAGTVVNDFYGVPWTNEADMVIKWKTQPAIVMTSVALRNSDQSFSAGNNGTLTKTGANIDVRFAFNASIDPTTIDATDFKIEPPVTGITFSPSGCGDFTINAKGFLGACTLRARSAAANWPAGTYTVTFLAGAKVKDIFGLEYTHPADTTITVAVEEAPAAQQCL